MNGPAEPGEKQADFRSYQAGRAGDGELRSHGAGTVWPESSSTSVTIISRIKEPKLACASFQEPLRPGGVSDQAVVGSASIGDLYAND
jgi:hypothetical protein